MKNTANKLLVATMALCLATALLVFVVANGLPRPASARTTADAVPTRMLFGFEPLRISPYEIQLQRGSAATSTVLEPNLMELTSAYTLDIRDVGAGGRDYSAAPAEGWHYIWLLYSTSTQATAAVMSQAELGGDLIIPSGYNRIRKLNSFAFYYSATTGIRRYVFTHWPNAFIYNTEADNSTAYQVLTAGSSTSWLRFPLSVGIAPSARVARVQAKVSYVNASGSCYIRTPGLGTGINVGHVTAQAPHENTAVHDIATSSSLQIEYKCDAGVTLDLFALGYSIQETY